MTDSADLFDVSGVPLLTDAELAERRRHLLRLERAQFHDTLSPLTFIGTAGHLMNPRLDEARWAVEKEMRRRGIWPPPDDE